MTFIFWLFPWDVWVFLQPPSCLLIRWATICFTAETFVHLDFIIACLIRVCSWCFLLILSAFAVFPPTPSLAFIGCGSVFYLIFSVKLLVTALSSIVLCLFDVIYWLSFIITFYLQLMSYVKYTTVHLNVPCFFIYLLLCVMCEGVRARACHGTCGGQRTVFRSWFSLYAVRSGHWLRLLRLWQVFLPVKPYRRPLYAFFVLFVLIIHSACSHVNPVNMSVTVDMLV